MKYGPSWHNNASLTSQKISCILWNHNVHHSNPTLVHTHRQINPFQDFLFSFFEMQFVNLLLLPSSAQKILPLRFTHKDPVWISLLSHTRRGTWWPSWLRLCATGRTVACSIPQRVIRIFLTQSFQPHYGPGADSVSNRNINQGIPTGGQRRPARRSDNLTTVICRLARNSGSFRLLEPLGPLQGQFYPRVSHSHT